MNDEYYMNEALKNAKIAFNNGDVPVGAVIVQDNRIIASTYNMREINKNAIYHAEILAIEKACKAKNDWHLNDCTLYVTLEPCMMCAGAILQSRIGRVVYGAKCDKFGYAGSVENVLQNSKNAHSIIVKSEFMADKSIELLKKFFDDKR